LPFLPCIVDVAQTCGSGTRQPKTHENFPLGGCARTQNISPQDDRLKSALSSIIFPPTSADNSTIHQSERFGDVILEATACRQ
jgi:hypothetical protein